MNTFRTVSRVLVAAAVVCVSNASAMDYVVAMFVHAIDTVAKDNRLQTAIAAGVGVKGVNYACENSDSPVVLAVAEAVAVTALTKDAKAGVVTAATSLGVSGVTYMVGDTGIANSVSKTISPYVSPKVAKCLANVVVSAGAGIMMNSNSGQKISTTR